MLTEYRTDDTCATAQVRHATTDRNMRALPTRGHARPRVHRAVCPVNNQRARRYLYYTLKRIRQYGFLSLKWQHTVCLVRVLSPSYTFATLDDDLYGIRASDNQVKTTSSRKAGKEGHCVDALADALFCVTLMVRFRRRGESQASNVEKLVRTVVDARGEESLSGFVFTADRGYGKMSMIAFLARKGIGFIFIMPEHLLRCHPFVGASQFDPAKMDIDESDAEDGSDAASDSIQAQSRNSTMLYDRENAFTIDENPKMGNLCKRAENLFKDKDTSVSTRVTAVALRERGTKKFAKTFRFVSSLPSSLSKLINCWVAVPRSMSMSESLFTKRANDGALIVPPTTSHDNRDLVESHCLNNTVFLTVDQSCADRFVLRQFCITGKVAGTILMNNSETLSQLGITDVECHERTMAECL